MEQWAGFGNNDFSREAQQTENTWILPVQMVPVPQSSCLYKRRGKKSGWSALIKACPSTFRGRRAGRFSARPLSWRH